MEQFLTPQYLGIFAIAVLGFGTWYFFNHRKMKSQKTNEKTKEGEVKYNSVNALIFDRTTVPFSWYEDVLKPETVKTIVETKNIGRQVVYMGKKVFRYYKIRKPDAGFLYEAVTEPNDVKNSPTGLYIDMQHPYVPILDDCSSDKNFMQKYGHLLLWAGIVAFLIVMVITNK